MTASLTQASVDSLPVTTEGYSYSYSMLNYLRQSLSCSAGFRATLISLILESLFARAVLHIDLGRSMCSTGSSSQDLRFHFLAPRDTISLSEDRSCIPSKALSQERSVSFFLRQVDLHQLGAVALLFNCPSWNARFLVAGRTAHISHMAADGKFCFAASYKQEVL